MLFTGCVLQHKSSQLDKELKSVKQEIEEVMYKCQKTDEEYDSLVCVRIYHVCIACAQVLCVCTCKCLYVYVCLYIGMFVASVCTYIYAYIHFSYSRTLVIQTLGTRCLKKHSDKKMQYITHYSYVEYSTLHVHVQVFSRMTKVTFHIIECSNNWGLDNRASTICIKHVYVHTCVCMHSTYVCVYMHMYICVHIIHDIAQSAVQLCDVNQ